MNNTIYKVTFGGWRSLLIREDDFILSTKRLRSLDLFQEQMHKLGNSITIDSCPISSINSISHHNYKNVTLRFTNQKGKDKKCGIGFSNKKDAENFLHKFGTHIGYNKVVIPENKLIHAGKLLFIAAAFTFLTIHFAGIEDTSTLIGNNRDFSLFDQVAKYVLDNFGPNGIYVLGSFLVIFTIYQMMKRYRNPIPKIHYVKD